MTATPRRRVGDELRRDLRREAVVMALYVSVVLLAALVALPADYEEHPQPGLSLLAIVWGTSIGLALAHWFAFELAAIGFAGGEIHRRDLALAGAQVVGAIFVAVATSALILVAEDDASVSAAAFAPSLIVGLAGFAVARIAGARVARSILFGALVLLVGVAVAVLKAALGGH